MPRQFSKHDLSRLYEEVAQPPRETLGLKLSLIKCPPKLVTAIHEIQADNIIANEKNTKKRKSPFLKTRRRKQSHTYKIVTDALPSSIDQDLPTGVIQALLIKGGDSSCVKNADLASDLESSRAYLLLKAVAQQNLDTISLFACSQHNARLNDALSQALETRRPDLVRRLLEHGANPNHCKGQIATLALEANVLLLTFLRRAPIPILADVAFDALCNAVKSGCLNSLTLMAEIADLDEYAEVPALTEAMLSLRYDMMLTLLVRCSSTLRAASLDRFVLDVYEGSSLEHARKCQFIDVLLYAGADGIKTCATFVLAVEHNNTGIIELFIKHKVDINWGKAKAACYAARSGDSYLLSRVLEAGSLTAESACLVIDALAREMPATERTTMLRKLLQAGAQGPVVDKALIYAVQDARSHEIELLRSRGATIDVNGTALIEAIKTHRPDTLALLLAGPFEPSAIQHAFLHLETVPKQAQYEMTKMLLEKGACGQAVSAALQKAVCDRTEDRDDRLIEVLVKHGADPSFERSKSFRHVVRRSDLKTFTSLLRSTSKLTSITASEIITDVSLQEDVETRHNFYQEMITTGVPKDSISQALCLELEMPSCHKSIIELLLHGKADVSYNNGRALEVAASKGDEETLQLVTASASMSGASNRSAVLSVLRSAAFDDEAKTSRLKSLLKFCQPPLAYEGILSYVHFCGKTYDSGREWPLLAFSLLVSHKPNVNTNGGELLRECLSNAAFPLLRLLLPLGVARPVLDAGLQRCMDMSNENHCLEAISIILQAKPSFNGVSVAFSTACRQGKSLSICKMLLDNGADMDFQDSVTVIHAVANADMNLLKFILDSRPTQQTLATAFDHATRHSDPRVCYDLLHQVLTAGFRGYSTYDFTVSLVHAAHTNCRLLQLCVDHDALSHAPDSLCAVHATVSEKLDVLRVLAPKAFNAAVASACLQAAMQQRTVLKCTSTLIEFLLDHGAQGTLLSEVLLTITCDLSAKDANKKVEILLQHGADVNASNGESLFQACSSGNFQLITLLAQAQSSVQTRARALHALVDTDSHLIPGPVFCSIHEVLRQKREWSQDIPTFAHCQPSFRHGLRVLLSRRPRGKEELAAILEAEPGLLKTPRLPSTLQPGRLPTAGEVPDILYWAFTETTPRIDTACIGILIAKGADTRYITDNGESMAMVAVQTGRSKLVDALRARGTDLSRKDSKGRTPLLYAVQQEKVDAVGALVSHVLPDDGSLHQAVRKLNPDLVRVLLNNSHDATIPSSYPGHNKTTPLMELLSVEVDPSRHHTFNEIFDLLLSHGVDITKKIDTKPLICAATDRGYEMTDAILSAGLRVRIDEDFNIHNDGVYYYSPIWYVSKKLDVTSEARIRLISLLRTYGAQREVYYKLEGPQPDDAVGMPPHIERVERERCDKLQRERELQDAIKREQLRQEQAQEHQLMLEQQRHNAAMQLRLDAANREAELLDAQHTRALVHSRELYSEDEHRREMTATALGRERAAELAHEQARMRVDLESAKKRQDLEYSHRKAIMSAESQAMEEQMRQQKKMAEGVNWLEQRQHSRMLAQVKAMERIGADYGSVNASIGYRPGSVHTLPSTPRLGGSMVGGGDYSMAVVPRKPSRR